MATIFKDFAKNMKKQFRHAKHSVGAIPHTESNDEFDLKVKEWEAQVESLRRLKESLEVFLDAMATFGAASSVLSESITQHFSMSSQSSTSGADSSQPSSSHYSPFLEVSKLFETVNSDITNIVQPALRSTMINRCEKPLNAILSTTPSITERLAARKTIMIDRDVYFGKVEKDSSAKVVNKADLERHQKKLNECSMDLEKIEMNLIQSFEEFDEALPYIFGNEMAALVASMYYYSSSSTFLLGQVLPFLPQTQSTLCLLSMATASSKFLESPNMKLDMESRAIANRGTNGEYSAPVVPLLFNRGELSGGSAGLESLEKDTPTPAASSHSLGLSSHSNVAPIPVSHLKVASNEEEEFISPLHCVQPDPPRPQSVRHHQSVTPHHSHNAPVAPVPATVSGSNNPNPNTSSTIPHSNHSPALSHSKKITPLDHDVISELNQHLSSTSSGLPGSANPTPTSAALAAAAAVASHSSSFTSKSEEIYDSNTNPQFAAAVLAGGSPSPKPPKPPRINKPNTPGEGYFEEANL